MTTLGPISDKTRVPLPLDSNASGKALAEAASIRVDEENPPDSGNSVEDWIAHLAAHGTTGDGITGVQAWTGRGKSDLYMAAGVLALTANDQAVRSTYYVHDMTRMLFTGYRTATRLRGTLRLDHHVAGVNWPSEFGYRLDNGVLTPSTDGSDTATSDLSSYMGSARSMWWTDTEFNELISDTSKSHTLRYPHNNFGEPLYNDRYNDPFQFGFSTALIGGTLSDASAEVPLTVFRNDGDGLAPQLEGVTTGTLTRVAGNRYTLTLDGRSNAVKVSDLWWTTTQEYGLNSPSWAVAVNGRVGFSIPYYPNSRVILDIGIDMAVAAQS
ncbi:MAG: hypothetical protein OXH70_17170 [Acidobacteria bacterium]|nr:hypothetical protein [Acidobacteriota bacterium]